MIKFQATAIIHYISAVIEVPSKSGGQPFQKRELILDDSWDKDGQHYANFIVIEFSGEKLSQLDGFWQGQRVTVDCILSGREYNGRVFNTVRGQSIAPAQQQAPYSPAPMPGGYAPAQMPGAYPPQQPTPAYPQPNYAQQYVPPTAPVGMPQQQPPVATGYPPMPTGTERNYYPG